MALDRVGDTPAPLVEFPAEDGIEPPRPGIGQELPSTPDERKAAACGGCLARRALRASVCDADLDLRPQPGARAVSEGSPMNSVWDRTVVQVDRCFGRFGVHRLCWMMDTCLGWIRRLSILLVT